MSDLGEGIGPEDRTAGLEPVDGFSFESDGSPIAELDVNDADALADRGASVAELAANRRSWRFGHVIVDEAQDLSPMQWRMLVRRASGNSMTIVGDLAQCSTGNPTSWDDLLPPALADVAYRELTINYRSPAEINTLATAVLRELAPGLSTSEAIRSVDHHPTAVKLDDLDHELVELVTRLRSEDNHGRLAVIGLDLPHADIDGVRWLTPWQAKGLEFDAVVLVEPARILDERRGLSLLYVAITRSTDRLVVAHRRPLPEVFAGRLA